MKNAKHTIAGVIAIAMTSTIAAHQMADMYESNRLGDLLTNNREISTSISYNTLKLSTEPANQNLLDMNIQDKLTYINRKTKENTAYVMIHTGTLNVHHAASASSKVIDQLMPCDEVEIIYETNSWYKIRYSNKKTGYVAKENITEDYTAAIYAAMHYDHYKTAVVKTDGSKVNVRSEASENAPIICQLENGTELILVYDENEYTKVFYGDNHDSGFVISSSIELTNQWISKEDVNARQIEIALCREAASELAAEKIEEAKRNKTVVHTPISKGQQIVDEAKKYLGVRYRYGGTTPRGFDCSGYVQYVCKKVGISITRTSSSQFGEGRAVKKSELMPGDLLFFGKGKRINHVGIYVGNGQMIHSPQSGEVVSYCSINDSYRTSTYKGARRLY